MCSANRRAPLFECHSPHGLPEAKPASRMSLLAHRVVPLGAQSHRQHVVGEPGGLAPHRRERHVEAHLRFVFQHLHPREAVGVGPQRVVDAREVHVELAAAFFEEMRQQETHLEERERELLREQQLVPVLGSRRRIRVLRHEFVRDVQIHSALLAHRAHQDHEEVERAGNLPSPQVTGGRGAPTVSGKRRAGIGNRFSRFQNLVRRDARLAFSVLRRELRVFLFEGDLECVKRHR